MTIDTKTLTVELIDALTRHGGYSGLSMIECEARVVETLKHAGLCVCADAPVEPVTEPVAEPVKPVRKPKPTK